MILVVAKILKCEKLQENRFKRMSGEPAWSILQVAVNFTEASKACLGLPPWGDHHNAELLHSQRTLPNGELQGVYPKTFPCLLPPWSASNLEFAF